jgi:serine protease Do
MKRWFVFVVVFGLGLATGSLAWNWSQAQIPNLPPPPIAAPAIPKEFTSYRAIVKAVLPAVVSIEAKAKAKAKPLNDPRGPDDLRRFFDGQQELNPRLGFGSGFFVDASGVILTNYHVIEGAESVTVTLNDGRKFTSTDLRGDQRTDLAIVMLDGKGQAFPVLEMGDSDQYDIGDRVLAVGAPFGLTGSVTHGIVSAKGRNGLNMNMYEDFIQTDAAINPGNSGGPLVGIDGKVIGINAAIKSRSGGFQGVGLAVASNLAKTVVNALKTDGVIKRGYLGVQIREVEAELALRLKLPKDQGVQVGRVFDNTPASKAGLLVGDIILSVEGRAIRDGRSLQFAVASLPINKAAKFEILRDGRPMSLAVTIEEQPREFGMNAAPSQRIEE